MSVAPGPLVAEARPRSAWMLISVASATLWITGQLAPWVIGVQVAAGAFSYSRRLAPHALQRSGIALNLGMMFITATTISVALRGHPSTVALAHFCALTQVLQILDVRPRKSEFLLVTLALFQVILAANLTDSAAYPPLLLLFVGAATWTLVVHTLRVEAARAQVPPVRAMTRGLGRLTIAASLLSVALAFVFFVAMPRLKTQMLRGGVGNSRAVAGFSDHVELGTIGRIRQDRTVVLRVETLEGEAPRAREAYWRGLAFDAFDGLRWSISTPDGEAARTGIDGSPRFGRHAVPVPLGATAPLVQQVTREPVSAGVLFSAGTIRRLHGPKTRVEVDPNGGFYAPAGVEDRIRYRVWSQPQRARDAELALDRALPPVRRVGTASLPDDRVLALPALDPAVRAMAERLTAGATHDLARARALEQALRSRGRYTDVPPEVDREASRTPVEQFLLGELAGHCEYFASGMVVLARSIGLPARLVNGFAGGRANRLGGFVELTRADAHAWVELHFEKAGWVRFDPTPPDLRLRAAAGFGLVERLTAIGSAFELWWFQRVVEFDASDQMGALRRAFAAWKGVRTPAENRRVPSATSIASLRAWFGEQRAPLGTVALLLAGLAWVRWQRGPDSTALPAEYQRALRVLAARGVVRGAGTAARDLVPEARRVLPAGAAQAFSALTEGYLEQRFGGGAKPQEFWAVNAEAFKHGLKLEPAPRMGLRRLARARPKAPPDGRPT